MSMIVNTSTFEANVSRLIAASPAFAGYVLEKASVHMETQAKSNLDANRSVISAKLKNSIAHRLTVNSSGAKSIVGVNAKAKGTDTQYGYFVEYGRGPVVATNTKALHFKVNGSDVFVKSVGAAPAKPFFRPALEATRNKISEIATLAFEKYARA